VATRVALSLCLALLLASPAARAQGLAGDPVAIERARQMVERVGGQHVWSQLASLQLRQRFHIHTRPESVIHVEWIDFKVPRIHVTIESELTRRQRAYDARGGWFLRDGTLTRYTDKELANERSSWKRDMFRMFHLIAADDPELELRMNGANRLEVFERASGELLCWFQLNVTNEPLLWGDGNGDDALEFLFGPLGQFGNIRVPRWGGFVDGSWRFDMIDAIGSILPPSVSYDPPSATKPP
jgi:hypothetical protein